MLAQRAVALLLTLLFFALVLVLFVAFFRAAGHPGAGWIVGSIFCVLMGLGGWFAGRRSGG